MGCRTTAEEGKVALFDSVTGWAFGLVFDSQEKADDFLRWLQEEDRRPECEPPITRTPESEALLGINWMHDPRTYTNPELSRLHSAWHDTRLDNEGELIDGGE